MAKWHSASICLTCWNDRFNEAPVTIVGSGIKTCCYCGNYTLLGIFIRDDAEMLKCEHIEV